MSNTPEVYWQDRKRILGMPISFTKYRLTSDRLFIRSGLFNIRQDEIMLYRIRDYQVRLNLMDRIFGVGDILIKSADESRPELLITNVKRPEEVKELIYAAMIVARKENRVTSGEFVSGGMGGDCGHTGGESCGF